MELMIVIALLILVEVLALGGAVDSRDGNDWVNHNRL
jgi:hypothetical protein